MCSADNGIYILQTSDGFRVAHAQAIDNLYWWPVECCNNRDLDDEDIKFQYHCKNCGILEDYEKKDEICPSMALDYFGDSEVYKTSDEAYKKACDIYEEIINDDFCPIVEYGIQFIDYLKDKDFNTFK